MTLYVPPQIPVFPAGNGPTSTSFNNWVQSTLGFQTQGIVFRAAQTVQQAINVGSFSTLSYDTVLEDPYNGWNSGSLLWVAPYSGWYLVSVFCSIATVSAILQVAVFETATTHFVTTNVTLSSASLGGGLASAVVQMEGGIDYVQGQAQLSSAGHTDVSTFGRHPSMEITFLSQ